MSRQWKWTWILGLFLGGGGLFLFFFMTKASPFSFTDTTIYQPLIHLLQPELQQSRQRLAAIQDVLRELPKPTPLPTGGTIGFISNPPQNNEIPSWVRLTWDRLHRVDAIAYLPVQKPNVFEQTPFYDAPQLEFVFLKGDKEVHRETIQRPQTKERELRGLLPFFVEIPPVEVDAILVEQQQTKNLQEPFAISEIFIFSEQWNIAPQALLRTNAYREGMLGVSLDYLCDDMTPLGLPQKRESHRFVGYRTGAKNSATAEAWIEFSWEQSHPIDEVRLFPVERLLGVNTITAGFPVEFDVQTWEQRTGDWKTLYRYTQEYSELPGLNPVPLRFPTVQAQRLRIRVHRLWKPSQRSAATLAFAEMQCRFQGRVMRGPYTIRVSDPNYIKNIFALPGANGKQRKWSVDALTDGMTTDGRILHERDWLQKLDERAEVLIKESVSQERLTTLLDRANRLCWRLTLGLLMMSFLGLMVWLLRQKIKHHAQIQEIRDHLAADLHDDLGSNLSALALYTQRLEHQLTPESASTLKVMARLVRESLYNLKEMVSVTSPQISTAVDLNQRLEQIIDIHHAGLPYSFRVEPSLKNIEIDPTHRRSLRLFLKEAMSNVVNHSQATQVDILLKRSLEGDIWLEILDNGRGLPAKVLDNPKALSTLRLRAEEMNASFRAENPASGGCLIAISLTSQSFSQD